jgi:iron-sulfur cluster repair protein YtfE (RIC family)
MKDFLTSDHLELDSLLQKLFAAFDDGDVSDVFKKLDFFWARLAMHIRAEHLHLFPAILKAVRKDERISSSGLMPTLEDVENSIRTLQNDHNFFMVELGETVKQMSDLRKNNPPDKAESLARLREKINVVRERLKTHNELEESQVYYWAEILSPAEIPALQAKIQREIENLPPRFAKAE